MEWFGKKADLLQVSKDIEQFDELEENTTNAMLEETIHLLSVGQIATLYDSSMTGDVNALIAQANELKHIDPKLMPLIDRIRQVAKDYDTDPIADLLEPFVGG